mgnify:CR=1 FL=1
MQQKTEFDLSIYNFALEFIIIALYNIQAGLVTAPPPRGVFFSVYQNNWRVV